VTMDPQLTREQEQVRESLREFLAARGGIDLARRYMEGEEGVVDDLWSELAEMTYTALTVPVEYGGFGEDVDYLAVVLEEAGRVAMPGPYPETMAFAAPLIAEAGTGDQRERYLPAIADGDHRASFALAGAGPVGGPAGGDPSDGEVEVSSEDGGLAALPDDGGVVASPDDGGYRLSGTAPMVPYGDAVDSVVVAARTDGEDGTTLFVVDGSMADAERLDSLDGSRPFARLAFDDVRVPAAARLGPLDGGELSRAVDRYALATCAMTVGAADRTVERSVEHANTREQFGGPIGRFQGVKHRIADMWMKTRASRSLVYYAAWSLANGEEDARKAVSSAKAYANASCIEVFEADIQNHGAMGFTWDHPTHRFLRQARAWENFPRDRRYHRDRVADERGF